MATLNDTWDNMRLAYITKSDLGAVVVVVPHNNIVHSESKPFAVWKCKRWAKANRYDILYIKKASGRTGRFQ